MPKKTKPESEPFWQEMVKTYFDFCKKKFNEIPSFDGSSPRDLKSIILSLKKRAELANIEWTEFSATTRLNLFLEEAFRDSWLSKNFILSNINRQKDKIFFNSAKKQTTGVRDYEAERIEKLNRFIPIQE